MSSSSLTDIEGTGTAFSRSRNSSATAAEFPSTQRERARINLNANFEARIENPLAGVPPRRLLLAVDEFCQEKKLEEHRLIIRKGALVARDPTAYEDISGAETLETTEIDALRNEVLHKWKISRVLLLTFVTCSIGAVVHGWDQTTANGATLYFPKEFGIAGEDDRSFWLTGLVNAAPYISTSLLGCWLSDPINDVIGRRGTIFLAANFSLWPVIGSAFCQTWEQLLVCRLLMGIGMGAKASTIPIYAAENSPAPIRGAFVMSWQLWTAFGIFLGTWGNFAVFTLGWRWQLGLAAIPAVPLCILIYFCPESPRWYMKKNRYDEAMKCLLRLRNSPIEAGRDLYYIHVQLELENQFLRRDRTNYVLKFTDLFLVPRLRRAVLAAFTVMIAQQMCGINVIAFYSTSIFTNAGFKDEHALLASCGFGFVNFIFAFPAIWAIDTFGRRSLLLSTFPLMTLALIGAGCSSFIPGETQGGVHVGIVALFVYLFAAFYSPGEGPIPFTYSAEVFPLSHREIGMAFAVGTCKFWASVLALTFPLMLARLNGYGSFLTYAGFNAVALVMIFFWVPETKQRTLEELDYIFAVPTTVFMKYQLTKALPWWFKRWVLWQKTATLEPLYQLDSAESSDAELEAAKQPSFELEKARPEMKYLAPFDFEYPEPQQPRPTH